MPDPIVSAATPAASATVAIGAAKVPAAAATSAAHHDGHRFDFAAALDSHTKPYPAVAPIHGQPPVLILNLPDYAKRYYSDLSGRTGFASVDGTRYAAWAKDSATGAWAGREADLAKAMTLASDKAMLGALPRPLAFLDHQLFWSTIALTLLAVVLLVFGRRRPDQAKPPTRLHTLIESLVLFIRDDIVRANIHHHADRWVPLLAGVFLMILGCNLFGLIPLFATATSSIFVTAAWAIPVFLIMLWVGMANNGPAFWFKIVPVPFTLKPFGFLVWLLLTAIEWASLAVKPAVLAIRLFANMLAGHTVLLVFACLGFVVHQSKPDDLAMAVGLGSFAWLVTIAFYFLKVLVCFVQAYVFTMLTAVFIGSCLEPEH